MPYLFINVQYQPDVFLGLLSGAVRSTMCAFPFQSAYSCELAKPVPFKLE